MSKQSQFDKVRILGVDVDVLTINEAVEYVTRRAVDRTHPASYVIKPYVEFIEKAASDPKLKQILNNAELSLPDGVALIWAAAFLYAGPHSLWRFVKTLGEIVTRPKALLYPLPERIAGINFTWPLLVAAAEKGVRVYLIGSPKYGPITGTVAAIKQQLPNINIVGTSVGRDPRNANGVSQEWLKEIASKLKQTEAELILVGMGFPLQEKVMAGLVPLLDYGVLIGEGGTFDYTKFGGKQPKAPKLMQQMGLEWLFRLIREPRRIKRQIAIPKFIFRVWRAR